MRWSRVLLVLRISENGLLGSSANKSKREGQSSTLRLQRLVASQNPSVEVIRSGASYPSALRSSRTSAKTISSGTRPR